MMTFRHQIPNQTNMTQRTYFPLDTQVPAEDGLTSGQIAVIVIVIVFFIVVVISLSAFWHFHWRPKKQKSLPGN